MGGPLLALWCLPGHVPPPPARVDGLAAAGPVLFKETLDHRYSDVLAGADVLAAATHGVMVRRPEAVVASYLHLHPDASRTATGLENLAELYDAVVAETGRPRRLLTRRAWGRVGHTGCPDRSRRTAGGLMRTVGNILWFVLAGLWLALGYAVAGLLAFVLIVTIPFGIASFRLASFVIWPFGRTTVWRRDAGIWSLIGNVVWVIFFGWELALMHLVTGLLLMVTIIGIPFGVACWKMIPLSLVPLGREIVPISSVDRDPYGIPA